MSDKDRARLHAMCAAQGHLWSPVRRDVVYKVVPKNPPLAPETIDAVCSRCGERRQKGSQP